VFLGALHSFRKFARRLAITRFPMPTKSSPYMLVFRDATPAVYQAMSAEQRQQLMEQWNAWYDGLAEQGKVQHGHPLQPAGRVVSGVRGERVVDGPFAESKEAIGGYFFLTVGSLDEATEIAQRCPSLRYGMSVEVRPVADACEALGVRGRPAKVAELAKS
jgi:hypothetical protein